MANDRDLILAITYLLEYLEINHHPTKGAGPNLTKARTCLADHLLRSAGIVSDNPVPPEDDVIQEGRG